MCASGGILINMEFDGWGFHTNLFLQLGNNMLGTIVATTQHTVPVWLWHGPNWLAHHGVSSLFGPFVEVLTISSENLFLIFIKILYLFITKLPSRAVSGLPWGRPLAKDPEYLPPSGSSSIPSPWYFPFFHCPVYFPLSR